SKFSKSFKYDEVIDLKLIELSKILKDTPGKHTYGYLPKSTKEIDVVVFTAPCQGMSVANHKKSDGTIEKNSLVIDALEIIK
ncbi:DNA cytosine methyltransferase, partial [Erysipelothrix rhusiopathiae]|nr:DNA cytosine methyltransferase [Erysipelothrix rhusiopathiae]